MADHDENPRGKPEGVAPIRVLIVDDLPMQIPHEALRRALGDDVILEPQMPRDAVLLGSDPLLDVEAIRKMIDFIEPASMPTDPFPRNRQGKDYDSVFRRPGGRPRR